MTYSDCKVLSVLQHKEEPLISKIPCDEYTQLAQSYFDYEFLGESKFYPYKLPKVLNEIDYKICVITGSSGKGKSVLLKEFSFYQKELRKFDNSKSVISNFDFTDKEDCMDRLASVGLSTVPTWCRPRNVKLFGSTKRAEWLEQPSVEELVNTSLNASRLDLQISPLKRKQKATTL